MLPYMPFKNSTHSRCIGRGAEVTDIIGVRLAGADRGLNSGVTGLEARAPGKLQSTVGRDRFLGQAEARGGREAAGACAAGGEAPGGGGVANGGLGTAA